MRLARATASMPRPSWKRSAKMRLPASGASLRPPSLERALCQRRRVRISPDGICKDYSLTHGTRVCQEDDCLVVTALRRSLGRTSNASYLFAMLLTRLRLITFPVSARQYKLRIPTNQYNYVQIQSQEKEDRRQSALRAANKWVKKHRDKQLLQRKICATERMPLVQCRSTGLQDDEMGVSCPARAT